MNEYAVFTDVSLNPQLRLGMGACLVLAADRLLVSAEMIFQKDITSELVIRKFEDTSSTKLEIETLLWALDSFPAAMRDPHSSRLRFYTDSQCIAGLPSRRQKLESCNFSNRSSGRELNNALLYRKFYELFDKYGFDVIKVTGHSKSSTHDTVHRIFSIVDREVRHALKSWVNEINN